MPPLRGVRQAEVRDVAKRELIGLDVTVVASGDPGLVGLEGRVADESRNTFLVERPDGREARVPKRGQSFAFVFPEGTAVVQGEALGFAPEDRIKKSR